MTVVPISKVLRIPEVALAELNSKQIGEYLLQDEIKWQLYGWGFHDIQINEKLVRKLGNFIFNFTCLLLKS